MLIPNNFDIENELQPELLSGEKLLWTGKPKSGLLLRKNDIFFIPFSLLWCGFAVFWESSVIASGAPFFFIMLGVPFVCAGLYITIGRFFFDKKIRNNTVYGITSNRVIIKSGILKKTTESIKITTLSVISIDEKSDGSGTIILGEDNQFSFTFGGGYTRRNQRKTPALEFIPGVRNVYNLILQQQNQN
jgi:hypothetical protein